MERLLSGKITSKGQLTIPVELRNYLNMEEGDRLEFILDDSGGLSVVPKKVKSIAEVVGILNNKNEVEFETARKMSQEDRGIEIVQKDLPK